MNWEDELEEEAGRLPPEVEPPRDLWPGIEDRLRSEQVRPASQELEARPRFGSDRSGLWDRGGARRRWGVGVAVAAGLVGLLAGSLLLNAPTGGPARGEVDPPLEEGSLAFEEEHLTLEEGSLSPDDPSSTVSVSAEPRAATGGVETVQAAFEPELQELRLLAESQELAPETRAVLDESLATIEAAMEEARAAVEADPYAPRAVDRLRRMYEAKLELFHVMTTQRPPAG
jgi:hypothetical protein